MDTQPKIIITGGLGFIFSHVTEYFVQKGWRVVVIDTVSEGSCPEIIDGSFVHHTMHMADPSVINLILEENPDYVIHAAAITDVDYSVREPRRTLEKNVRGTLHAFEACRQLPNLKKFMYVSTDEIYGECDTPKTEDDIILPKNPYSASKAAGSLMRVAYDNTYPALKGKTVEMRCCNVFGPRQDKAKVLARIKYALQTDTEIPVHNGGTGYREYIYVKNIPPAVDLILTEGVDVYNISNNDGYTVQGLLQKVEEVTGRELKTIPSHRPGMDMKYQTDSTRIRELGWKPLYTFEEGLKEYLLS